MTSKYLELLLPVLLLVLRAAVGACARLPEVVISRVDSRAPMLDSTMPAVGGKGTVSRGRRYLQDVGPAIVEEPDPPGDGLPDSPADPPLVPEPDEEPDLEPPPEDPDPPEPEAPAPPPPAEPAPPPPEAPPAEPDVPPPEPPSAPTKPPLPLPPPPPPLPPPPPPTPAPPEPTTPAPDSTSAPPKPPPPVSGQPVPEEPPADVEPLVPEPLPPVPAPPPEEPPAVVEETDPSETPGPALVAEPTEDYAAPAATPVAMPAPEEEDEELEAPEQDVPTAVEPPELAEAPAPAPAPAPAVPALVPVIAPAPVATAPPTPALPPVPPPPVGSPGTLPGGIAPQSPGAGGGTVLTPDGPTPIEALSPEQRLELGIEQGESSAGLGGSGDERSLGTGAIAGIAVAGIAAAAIAALVGLLVWRRRRAAAAEEAWAKGYSEGPPGGASSAGETWRTAPGMSGGSSSRGAAPSTVYSGVHRAAVSGATTHGIGSNGLRAVSDRGSLAVSHLPPVGGFASPYDETFDLSARGSSAAVGTRSAGGVGIGSKGGTGARLGSGGPSRGPGGSSAGLVGAPGAVAAGGVAAAQPPGPSAAGGGAAEPYTDDSNAFTYDALLFSKSKAAGVHGADAGSARSPGSAAESSTIASVGYGGDGGIYYAKTGVAMHDTAGLVAEAHTHMHAYPAKNVTVVAGPRGAAHQTLVSTMTKTTFASAAANSAPAALEKQLDWLERHAAGVLLRKYRLEGPTGRRKGGQGVVAFATDKQDPTLKFAIKFYLSANAFSREREAITNPDLQGAMPAAHEIVGDEASRRSGGLGAGILPPMIITERGESLNEYVQRQYPDFITSMQVILQIAKKLQIMHKHGYAHRDLKPGNTIWLPSRNTWSLIDFGCSAPIGSQSGLSFSLLYAAPETVQAFLAGRTTVTVNSAVDSFAFGIMCYELLTRQAFYPKGLKGSDVGAMLAGEQPMPHEVMSAEDAQKLGVFKEPIVNMLKRDPSERPSIDALLVRCQELFGVSTLDDL